MVIFGDFDVSDFWTDSDYSRDTYADAPLDDLMVARIEAVLGYKLPASYVELCRTQNGGVPARSCHRVAEPTSWASDHVAIHAILGIGTGKEASIGGGMGQELWLKEWGYPPVGVYFADCPSAGHDMLCLDYRACGPHGEPQVVHVDQEADYTITFVAKNFETFIRGLESEGAFSPD